MAVAVAAFLLLPPLAPGAQGPSRSPTPVGSPATAVAGGVRADLFPAENGTCSMPGAVTSLNCTDIDFPAGGTFVAVVLDYRASAPNVSSPAFRASGISWFKTVRFASGANGVPNAPSLFALWATVTTPQPTGTMEVSIGAYGALVVDWWMFPATRAPVVRLAGSGSQGSGHGPGDPLSGTARGDTLISVFGSTRPVGAVSVTGRWNYTAIPANPSDSNGGLISFASWAWVGGSFTVPEPTWTTQYAVGWTAFSFTISDANPNSTASGAPPGFLGLSGDLGYYLLGLVAALILATVIGLVVVRRRARRSEGPPVA